jgi:hypothetical protein
VVLPLVQQLLSYALLLFALFVAAVVAGLHWLLFAVVDEENLMYGDYNSLQHIYIYRIIQSFHLITY